MYRSATGQHPAERPRTDTTAAARLELARALLTGSPWREHCRHLAWQVSMALAGKTWEAIRQVARPGPRRGDATAEDDVNRRAPA